MKKWIAVVSWSGYDCGGASVHEANAADEADACEQIAALILKERQAMDELVAFYEVVGRADQNHLEDVVQRRARERADEQTKETAAALEAQERQQLAKLKAKYGE